TALLINPLRMPRPKIVAFIEGLKASPSVEIVHIDAALDRRAWELFTQRNDKDWSLVDCSSFMVMKEFHITEALTTDHHFEQAGYVCLLKP
ncbi:VapC toxin family PIN domain ribonuclease, partial [Deltaproteobacteria bacterium TL4]